MLREIFGFLIWSLLGAIAGLLVCWIGSWRETVPFGAIVAGGLVTGMFGIGGGGIIVPVLCQVFRLMGVPEDYAVPSKYNDAYHLFGDGLAVPVVSWLNLHLLLPLASSSLVKMASGCRQRPKRSPFHKLQVSQKM